MDHLDVENAVLICCHLTMSIANLCGFFLVPLLGIHKSMGGCQVFLVGLFKTEQITHSMFNVELPNLIDLKFLEIPPTSPFFLLVNMNGRN